MTEPVKDPNPPRQRARLVQICGVGELLYALDTEGQCWEFYRAKVVGINDAWRLIDSPDPANPNPWRPS